MEKDPTRGIGFFPIQHWRKSTVGNTSWKKRKTLAGKQKVKAMGHNSKLYFSIVCIYFLEEIVFAFIQRYVRLPPITTFERKVSTTLARFN